MTLNQLKYFIAVAQSHSFTKAAQQFYISQTAITQQIKALEQIVGTTLIDRNKRPILLTPAGSVFLTEAKSMVEQMENAVTIAQNAASGQRGTLKIGYTKGYERSNLSNWIRGFHKDYPNIFVSCYRMTTDLLASRLVGGQLDLIYTWDSTNLQQNTEIGYCAVEDVPLMVALYPSHRLAGKKHLTRKDLIGEKFLYMSPSESTNSYGDAHFMTLYEEAGFKPQIVFRSTNAESILIMVASEQGISILPDYCTKKLSNADNLIFIPLKGEHEYERIDALWRTDNHNPALHQYLQLF
ncbi:LysR family transcriptional regulator [Eubacterium oxidoreducens]|uniref:DNA-binding transcriptional regulator, LysR family n=1 Tax=Eubacterium oxidoreducens TaxID=1732 RepID=A0A1G6AAK0_EUBOX|nr:LysR family transcriptional regulator [Eubacterium oxidoreducens]SDB05326.1 DNA-binding transcriptional regulator, LysR family [Eubacterium oxidoreducens]